MCIPATVYEGLITSFSPVRGKFESQIPTISPTMPEVGDNLSFTKCNASKRGIEASHLHLQDI